MYSKNFGFRSFENIVRRGRDKSPVGSTMKIGAPVTLDPASAGFVKVAVAGAATVGAGLAIYEHIQVKGIDPALIGTPDFDYVPANQFIQRVHGTGVKVWLKNTGAITNYDGRVRAAASPLDAGITLSGLAIGAQLTPNGTGGFKVANGTTDGNWLTVVSVNTTTGVVEATLNF